MQKFLILPLALAAIVGFGGWVKNQASAQTYETPPSFDLAEGKQLYLNNCASCHGANLEGQPNWRSPGPDGVLPAPPHDKTGHTWHHTDSALFEYTKLGGVAALARMGVEFPSGMPGFGDQLSDAQIWNILAYIKSTWPTKQSKIQAARSAAERQGKND